MSYYGLCEECNAELPHPKLEEKIVGYIECPKCEHHAEVSELERFMGIQELVVRLKRAENNIVELYNRTKGENK